MGYDPLLNLVLDNTIEYQKGKKKKYNGIVLYERKVNIDHTCFFTRIDLETGYITEKTRQLGLSVLRGTAVILISPFDGMEEIENPFSQ